MAAGTPRPTPLTKRLSCRNLQLAQIAGHPPSVWHSRPSTRGAHDFSRRDDSQRSDQHLREPHGGVGTFNFNYVTMAGVDTARSWAWAVHFHLPGRSFSLRPAAAPPWVLMMAWWLRSRLRLPC